MAKNNRRESGDDNEVCALSMLLYTINGHLIDYYNENQPNFVGTQWQIN